MSDNRETELLAKVPDGLFIGGEWLAADGGKTLDVYDPATGEAVKTIANASPSDGMAALDAADAAFSGASLLSSRTSMAWRKRKWRTATAVCESARTSAVSRSW